MKLKLYNKLNEIEHVGKISDTTGNKNLPVLVNKNDQLQQTKDEENPIMKNNMPVEVNSDDQNFNFDQNFNGDKNKDETPENPGYVSYDIIKEFPRVKELFEKLKIYYDAYNGEHFNKEGNQTLFGFEFLQDHSLDNFNQLISEFNSNKKELLKNFILKQDAETEEEIYTILHFVIEISQKLLNTGIKFNNIKYQDIINNITELQNSINQEIQKIKDNVIEERKKDEDAKRKQAGLNQGGVTTESAINDASTVEGNA